MDFQALNDSQAFEVNQMIEATSDSNEIDSKA